MPKRILQGTVTSTANAQTVTVSVERRFKHPVLQKTIKKSKKYRVHDEDNSTQVGASVLIRECAPKSKTKRWEVMTPAMIEEQKAQHEELARMERERAEAKQAEAQGAE